MRDRWEKPLEKEKALKHLVAWKPRNHGEGAKVKDGTCAPKLVVYIGGILRR